MARCGEIPKNRMAVMYCNSGSPSAQAVFALCLPGCANVKVLQDGLESWRAKNGVEANARAKKPAGHYATNSRQPPTDPSKYGAWHNTSRGRRRMSNVGEMRRSEKVENLLVR